MADPTTWPTLRGQPLDRSHRVYPMGDTYHLLWGNLVRRRKHSTIQEVYGAQFRCGIVIDDPDYRTSWAFRQVPLGDVHGRLAPCPKCFPEDGA